MRLHLKTAIWASGKSQRRVAAECRLSENRLSEIVCGWVTPSVDEQQRLAQSLGQSIDVMFPDSNEPMVA